MGFGFPPRMAETDECWERAYFWMAEVIEMHSDMTREMGSTATDTGRLRYCILGASARSGERIIASETEGGAGGGSMLLEGCASRLMI